MGGEINGAQAPKKRRGMKNVKNKKTLWMILTGLIIGAISVVLVANGNPKNMGFCIACFIRDIAGGVGMHQAAIVQYIRPEIIGLVLGALIMSVAGKEFKAQGGSSPVTRFVLGFFVMVGALMFLGCPLRMVLRIAGGDLNAVVGLIGFVVGILAGIFCLNQGFSLRRTYEQSPLEGGMISAINVALLVLVVAAPPVIYFSTEGPGSMRAPLLLALAAGLVVGALAQKTRLCMVGGIRDAVLFKDFYLLWGFIAIIVAALAAIFAAVGAVKYLLPVVKALSVLLPPIPAMMIAEQWCVKNSKENQNINWVGIISWIIATVVGQICVNRNFLIPAVVSMVVAFFLYWGLSKALDKSWNKEATGKAE